MVLALILVIDHQVVTWVLTTLQTSLRFRHHTASRDTSVAAQHRYQSPGCSTRSHPFCHQGAMRAKKSGTSGWFRVDQSRSAGSMGATVGSFQRLATCCDISARNRARRPRHPVPTVVQSSREQLQGTATCYTINASRGAARRHTHHSLLTIFLPRRFVTIQRVLSQGQWAVFQNRWFGNYRGCFCDL